MLTIYVADDCTLTRLWHKRNMSYHYTTHIQDTENSNTDLWKILLVIHDKSIVQDTLKQPAKMALGTS